MNDRYEQAAIACGATHYSPPPMRAVKGFSFTYEQMDMFADNVLSTANERIAYLEGLAAVKDEALIGWEAKYNEWIASAAWHLGKETLSFDEKRIAFFAVRDFVSSISASAFRDKLGSEAEAAEARIKESQEQETALKRYEEFTSDGDSIDDPVEALRFFCSLCMKTPQDWLDIERFFDAVIAEREELRKLLEESKVPEVTPDLIEIFGRPNFTCIRIADVLRKGGQAINNRSEDEQAATILFLYKHYLNNKAGWRDAANEELKAMLSAAPQPSKESEG